VIHARITRTRNAPDSERAALFTGSDVVLFAVRFFVLSRRIASTDRAASCAAHLTCMLLVALSCQLAGCGTDEAYFEPANATGPTRDAADGQAERLEEGGGRDAGDHVELIIDATLDEPSLSNAADALAPPERDATSEATPLALPIPDTGASCEDRAPPPDARPSCSRLNMGLARITASSVAVGASTQGAVDGDPCSGWRSSGAPPQWLVLEMCTGSACALVPRVSTVGLYVDGKQNGSITVELQGASADAAVKNGFYTISSRTFAGWKHDDYIEMTMGTETPEVLRIVFNSGPPEAVVLREVVFLDCR